MKGEEKGMKVLVKSLEEARKTVREIKKQGDLPKGGITLLIERNEYFADSSFELGKDDSGTAECPVIYRGKWKKHFKVIGGKKITKWTKLSDPAIVARISSNAVGNVWVADLKDNGISDPGVMKSRGFGRPVFPAALELFCNGEPMTIARWPNIDFVHITGIVSDTSKTNEWGNNVGSPESGFYFKNERIKKWHVNDNIWVHGYWCWDWANSYERVVSIDKESGLIKTAEPYCVYGFRTGQRFFFLNVLEELDQPGEWYLDYENSKIYLWPPFPMKDCEIYASVLAEPLVVLKDVSHVRFENFEFQYARGNGVSIEGGNNVVFAGCKINNVGNHGISVKGGYDHKIVSCDISYTGDCGIHIEGGDRKTLVPCNHVVENCEIHHFSRWSRCYCPAIYGYGVGMKFISNRMYHAPHTAILFSGNEFLIEGNEIYQVCMETGDAGAIYLGRDYTFRGNIVRRNFIHHMGGVGMGTMGVYNDDCVSGTLMENNVFYRCTRAAMLGGGRELRVINNLFIECYPAINFDARGVSPHQVWQRMVNGFMKEQAEKMNYLKPPYIERYPELAPLEAYFKMGKGVPPENCVAERNVCMGGVWLDGEKENATKWLTQRNNVITKADAFKFRKPATLDFTIRQTPVLKKIKHVPIDCSEIGLKEDRYRRKIPSRKLIHVYIGKEMAKDEEDNKIFCLVVENRGHEVAYGRVGVRVLNSLASLKNLNAFREDIKSGICVDGKILYFVFKVDSGKTQQFKFGVIASNNVRKLELDAFVDGEEYVRHHYEVNIPIEIPVHKLNKTIKHNKLNEALLRYDWNHIHYNGSIAARVKFALVPHYFAVTAHIKDRNIVRMRPLWKGSCLEIFTARHDGTHIKQLFIAPSVSGKKAIACYAENGKEIAARDIRVSSEIQADGYGISALIPYRYLSGSPRKGFLLEVQTGISLGKNKGRDYIRLAGSNNPSSSSVGYGKAVIG